MRRAAALALLLAGCAVGPDYEPPAVDAPAAWTSAAAEITSAERADLAEWWTVFGDPALDALVGRALEGSRDLRIAEARVREARALAGIADGALPPSAGAGASYDRSSASGNGTQSLTPFPVDDRQSLYRAGFDAAWEIDLFGRLRRASEAARADAGAAEEDLRAVRVSLVAEVARTYVELRGAQRQAALQREQLAAARESASLVRSRLDAGVGSDLDLARAEALAAALAAQIPASETLRARAAHRLAVLVGAPPGRLDIADAAPVPVPPARIVVGLPSDLLLRRPDLRAAERRAAAATARIGVALGDLLPRISLTGAFGVESLESEDLFRSASRTWAFGPAVRWPVFEGGRLRANVRVQEERQVRAVAEFERAFLVALEDAENALVAWFREGERLRSLREAEAAQRRAHSLAEELNRRGLASFLEALDARRSLAEAERLRVQGEAALSLAAVSLFKALGGGWSLPAD